MSYRVRLYYPLAKFTFVVEAKSHASALSMAREAAKWRSLGEETCAPDVSESDYEGEGWINVVYRER